MHRIIAQISNFIAGSPGKIYLWFAVLIFGAANAITRQLTELGAQNLVDGRNPISSCNVLFAGNICALLLLLAVYRQQLTINNCKQIPAINWLSMAIVAILSGAIAPGFIFEALSRTMVTNVVLIGRIETPLALVLSILFLRARVDIWTITGAIVSLLGVFTTVVLQTMWENMMSPDNFISVGVGEIMTAVAALALAIATIVSQAKLQQIPLGIFSVFRTVIATVSFFVAAIYFFGAEHFMDVFSPFLWQWMLIYAAVIVVLGQLAWFTGLKNSTPSDVSLVSSFTPLAGILAAYLILGEAPSIAQYIGGSIVLLGIFLNQVGIQRQTKLQTKNSEKFLLEAIDKPGFKGM